MKKILFTLFCLFSFGLIGQTPNVAVFMPNSTGIGTDTPDPSARLDVFSLTSGFLLPRLTQPQRDAISAPAKGLIIFNTTSQCINFYNSVVWSEICGTTAPIQTFLNCGDLYTDERDNQAYQTVQIGNQCWMSENLNYDVDASGMSSTGTGPQSSSSVGRFYSWAGALDIPLSNNTAFYGTTGTTTYQGQCPVGWHIPDNQEWCDLAMDVTNLGNALKLVGQGSGAGAGTNTSGFSATLAGYQDSFTGNFLEYGITSRFWTATESTSNVNEGRSYHLYYNNNVIDQVWSEKSYFYNVRCVKD